MMVMPSVVLLGIVTYDGNAKGGVTGDSYISW